MTALKCNWGILSASSLEHHLQNATVVYDDRLNLCCPVQGVFTCMMYLVAEDCPNEYWLNKILPRAFTQTRVWFCMLYCSAKLPI